MTTRIKLRRDTAANWTAANPILAAGEPGLETDTGKIKYGDGTTAWTLLEHAGSDTLNDEGGVVVTAGSTNYWVASQRRNNNDTYGRGLRHDSNGNVYALTQGYDDNDNFAVITKYSPVGAVIWQHTIDQFTPYSLAVDSSDRAYIAGEDDDNGDRISVWKFDTDGVVLWKKNYDAGNWTGECFIEERTGTRLALVANRDNGDYGVLVLDINTATGEIVTKRNIEHQGGEVSVWCAGIDTDANGNVFVTGRYYDNGSDKYKMFVEKLNGDLTRVWSKSLETDTGYDMSAGDCASDSLGNVYAVGYYTVDINNVNGNGTNTAGVLIKLNSSGTTQWTRRLGPGPCGMSVVGLTATDAGDVYLVTTTLEFSKNPNQQEWERFLNSTTRLIVARYDTAGAVIWQRYVDASHSWENNDTFRGQTISVYDDKFVIDFYGESYDTTPNQGQATADDEVDCFIVQLPTDGTDLEIGDVSFKASRIPGRFVTHETSASPLNNVEFEANIDVATSGLAIDSQVRIANSLVKSTTYDYVFGADGTLTIPNDGDVRLTQSQIGYLGAIGGSRNYDDDRWGRAVTADTAGNMYVAGEDNDNGRPFVVKIDPEGLRVWAVTIWDDNNNYSGRANGIALDPATGNVVVVCEMYGYPNTYASVVTIDQDTGRVLSNVEYKDSDSDVYLNEIAYLSTGAWVAGGSKYGEFSAEQTATPVTGSTTQKIVVARSEITGNVTRNWQIGGTGISPFENIAAVEQYSNLSTTVDGNGGIDAQFTIEDLGDGNYGVGSVTQGGSGYGYWRVIKILGTSLGGATPANDLLIRVTGVDAGAITSASVMSGTAAGSTYTSYSLVTGVNIMGSGFGFNSFDGPSYTNNYANYYTYNGSSYGTNYAIGDVLRVAGTDLGGTSPANDMTITVTNVGGSGEAIGYDIGGTAQSTNWTIITTTNVDFGQAGAWTLTYPLSRENILVTADWQRTYGTNTGDETDRTYAIAVDSSDNIIAVGQGYGVTTGQDSYALATVYKFNSSGTLQWAKKLNERNYDCYAMSVATIGTDIYVSHDSNDNGDTVITKLAADGTVKWQQITDSRDDSVVSSTDDGNILTAIEAYNSEIGDDALKIIKMTPSGETVYKRWLYATLDDDTRFKNGRSMVVKNGNIYVTAYFYANDYDSAFVACLPADGTGTGNYGEFRYTGVDASTGWWYWSGIDDVNYDVDLVNPGDSYAGALTVTPYVNTTATVTDSEGEYYVESYFIDYDLEQIRDQDGGAIVFGDGSVQTTSATDVPQRIYRGQKYTLSLVDRGHHILCTQNDDSIIIPYYARVPFPVGSKIMFVNDSGSNVYIYTEGSNVSVLLSGQGSTWNSFYLGHSNVATLLNIGRDRWVFFGDVDYD